MNGRMALHLPSFMKQVQIFYLNYATLFLLLSFISMLVAFKLTRRRRRSKLNLPSSPPRLQIIGNYHQLRKLPHRSFSNPLTKTQSSIDVAVGSASRLGGFLSKLSQRSYANPRPSFGE